MQNHKLLILSCLVSLLLVAFLGCGKTKVPAQQIYKQAKTITVKGAPAPGQISVVTINASELSQADLEEWYYHYAKPALGEKKFNYCAIAYSDKPHQGILYNGSVLAKDVKLNLQDGTGYYDKEKCEGTIIVESEGGKYLKPLRFG